MGTMQVVIFEEGDFSSYLGIGIYDPEAKTVTLTQEPDVDPGWVDLTIDLVRGDRWVGGGKVTKKEGNVLHLEAPSRTHR